MVVAGQQRLQRDGMAVRVVDMNKPGGGGKPGAGKPDAAQPPGGAPKAEIAEKAATPAAR